MKRLLLLGIFLSAQLALAEGVTEKPAKIFPSVINSGLTIKGYSPSKVVLSVQGADNQTTHLQTWRDSDGNILAQIQGNGRFYTTTGVKSDALQGGGSLMLWPEGGVVIEHNLTTNEADFDYTGGDYENLMTDASGVFAGADKGNWIIVRTGTYKGAMAEIKTVLDADNVILHTMGWDFDIADFGYYIIQHPQVVIGDGCHNEFQVGTAGHLDIHSGAWVGSTYSNNMFEVEMEGAADNLRVAFTEAECDGHNNIVGQEVYIETGDLSPGESVAGIYTHVDISEASSSDSTTSVPCFIAGVENGSDATAKAFLALAGFDIAFQVYGATEDNPDYGYEVASGSVINRVTGTPQDGTAFLSTSTSNVQIFDGDNDYILIGSDDTFEIVDVLLETGANRNVLFEFYYSTGVDTWATLIVVDTTRGARNNGQWNFNAPVDWAKGNQAEAAADITSAYYIKAVRTRNAVAVPPTESYFKIRVSKESGMSITGSGAIEPAGQAADPCGDAAQFPTGSIFYNSTNNFPCFCNEAGLARKMTDSADCY